MAKTVSVNTFRFLPFTLLLLLPGLFRLSAAIYTPIREYSGDEFFSEWDYYGDIDNTTWGNVDYVDQSTGASQRLTYIDPNTNHAIIRVDNTTNITAAATVNRNSVKITTKDAYPIGSLVIIDTWHIPYGCSVWPSFWMLGTNLLWPNSGEIDIIEAINNLDSNQYALHTTSGCFLGTNSIQSGSILQTNCSTGAGCVVQEKKPNSFGSGFAQAGGGVFATQLDVSGIYMWFWPRGSLPASISQANSSSTMNLADWGTPTAAYLSNACNITQYFQPQQLIIDITLCGVWAGVPSIYNSTGCSGQCIDNVIGTGNPIYNNAYWDIAYIRTYLATATTTVTTGNTSVSPASLPSASPASASTSSSSGANDANANAAPAASTLVHSLSWSSWLCVLVLLGVLRFC
ncbi:glycoside hydrolase family 16 protein [Lentinula edodes]|nr:glycoside hydrolase family 16 protein [Lentinula edodes]